jgi:hypothetical protein
LLAQQLAYLVHFPQSKDLALKEMMQWLLNTVMLAYAICMLAILDATSPKHETHTPQNEKTEEKKEEEE